MKKKKAFSLIEVLIVMFIAVVAFTAFYTVSTVGTRYIIESKNRLGAIAFANEKMEIVRNLQFSDVGLQDGIPAGRILQDEDVTANGRSYHVHTLVKDEDDSFDGTASDIDVIPNDYKVVKIIVSWVDSTGQQQQVASISRFVPPGLETNAGGAPLAINVKGSDGTPVPQASVHIVNNSVVPIIDYTIGTDDDGHIMIPSSPPSLAGYQFSISKNGYETVATSDPALLTYTPTYRHADVMMGVLNMYDYIEDELSKLTIRTLDFQNNPAPNIAFTIKGGKILGRNASDEEVVNFEDASLTDMSGEKVYAAISPGNYDIAMQANAQYELIRTEPANSPFALVPGGDVPYVIRVADKNINFLWGHVLDSETSESVIDAKLTLTDSSSVEIFSNKSVDSDGFFYYPDAEAPPASGEYTLKVEAADYTTQNIIINIDNITGQEVELVKII